MSDLSVDSYLNQDKEGKNGQDPFSGALTKAQHRNPDIHVLGDNLPNEIVSYQAGSGTLQPDVAGNTPVLLRQSFEVIGNAAGNQNLTGVSALIANLTQTVTCPLQASGQPFIMVSAGLLDYSLPTGGGVDSYSVYEFYSNGVVVGGSLIAHLRQYAVGLEFIPVTLPRKKININPGQTLNIEVRGYQTIPAGFDMQYAASALPDRAHLNVELYY